MARAALALALLLPVGALELTKETWDSAVSGKTVFVKFFAPWCGHCKRIKPDWDKLIAAYKDSSTILVADVDCDGAGKAKCNEVGVRGYPTLKYGNPEDLQDYKGGRTLADLKTFAESLGPQCGPGNLELCDAEKKNQIEEFQKISPADREKMIKEKEAEMEKLETDFKDFVSGVQKSYSEENDKKDKAVEAIKAGGLGLLKSVQAFQKKGKSEL